MAEKKVSLRNKQQLERLGDGIPTERTVHNASGGITGTMPYEAGVIGADSYDKLPDEVFKEMQLMKDKESVIPEHVAKTKLVIPKPIDINELPPEKFKELTNAIKESGFVTKKQEPKTDPIQLAPGVSDVLRLAKKIEQEPKKEEVKEEPVTTSESAKVDAALICTHCGWPSDKSDKTDPDTLDKRLFVASILGQKRFTKDYGLFGGQFHVVFRTLTVKETDLVIKQLVKDWNDGKISGPAQSIAEATKYQMVLSLESLDTAIGLSKMPTLDEYDYDSRKLDKQDTILPLVVEHVYSEALQMEPLRRAVSKAYGHFLDTVSKLEAMAETPSFWQAIAD